MKKLLTLSIAGAGLLLATIATAQMGMGGGQGRGMRAGGPPEGVSVVRHRYFHTHGLGPAYARSRNPLPASEANLKAGQVLYENTCASCHGASGQGDGPAAGGLDPAPAKLVVVMKMPVATDAFLDWTISEGGAPVGSVMPPFKEALGRDDIWKIVLYLRSL